MTEPAPAPPPLNLPLTTVAELAVWVQLPEIPDDKLPFANIVLEGTAVVIREAGSHWWVHQPGTDPLPEGHIRIPYRAKLMADLKAKNFFEHPTGAVSETTGPISERYLDEVVQQLQLTDDEKSLLAQLAAEGGPPTDVPSIQGIWALSTFRGPLETHTREQRGIIHVPYWRTGSKAIPYYAAGELGSPE